MKRDVIIIGAGLSGLYCGFLLQEMGYKVLILEARNRVGGRVYTENGADLGGTWVSSKQSRIMNLCNRFGLTLSRQHEQGLNIAFIDNKKTEFTGLTANAKITSSNSSIAEYVELFYTLSESLGFVSTKEHLDKFSLYDWVIKNVSDLSAQRAINTAFNRLTCANSQKVSFYFWLYFLKTCGGYRNVTGVREAAQEFRIEQGAQALAEKLAENLEVIFDAHVTKVERDRDQVRIYTQNQKIYTASKLVSSLPVQLIPKIQWNPGLEPDRLSFYHSMRMGCVTKLIIQYESAFWRKKGYSGKISCSTLPIALCYDACDTKKNALVVFVLDDKDYTDMQILEQLAFLFDDDLAKSPQKVYRKNWSKDVFSGGCYFSIPPVDSFAQYRHYLNAPCANIYFIGTETANEWLGYMEGALESAERVVKQFAIP